MDKQIVRERVWDALEAEGVAAFPFPPHGRIPNFSGASDAADRLAALPEFEDAETVKANPDSPQRPIRKRALEAEKTVYMAVPRLRDEKCFIELDPERIGDYDRASTISGSSELGVHVGPDEVDGVDLIVSGSVAVTEQGARIGKGEGYSDLEYAILRRLDLVDDATPVVTTVHELQVVGDEVAVEAHDVPMDAVVTPERVIRPGAANAKPADIDWSALDEERIDEMPVLARLRDAREST